MSWIGAVLAGKYRVERVLGEGGMGVVVQATHLQLAQPVAIKLLLPGVLPDAKAVQRFLREAQAAVRLKSEHVARVLDVGTLEEGEPYIVLEYLEGADLASYPRAQLSPGVVVDLVLQACEALAEAHALDIVHRDIKPANLFVTSRADGSLLLKVLDFGISKAPSRTGQPSTPRPGERAGTPAYMAPEQMRSARSVDRRSDIWALGVVLYELLQGVRPFQAATFTAMSRKIASEAMPALTVALPGRLAEVVARCLDKDPARRFQSVAELAHALAPYAASKMQATISAERARRVSVSPPPRPVARSSRGGGSAATITGAVGWMSTGHRRRRRWPLVVASLGIAGIAVLLGIALADRQRIEAVDAAEDASQSTSMSTDFVRDAPGGGGGPRRTLAIVSRC